MKNCFIKCNQLILAPVLVAVFVFLPMTAMADSLSSLKSQQQYYQQQAAAAAAAKAAKAAQAVQLSQDLTIVASQITQTSNSLDSTNGQIDQTQKNIDDLSAQIKTAEDNLAKEQDTMSSVVSAWYMEGQAGLLEAFLTSGQISDIVAKQQYYDSIKQQISGEMDQINKLKDDLTTQKTSQDQAMADLTTLKNSQIEQQNYLQGRQTMKSRLLTDTAAAITDLAAEQQSAEQQVAALQKKIDEIKAASVGAGGDVVSAGEASWYYQQNDSRWADYKIGRWSTIGTYGCLLTSLTMVADFYGSSYTPVTAAQNSSFVQGGSADGAMTSTSIVSDGKSQSIDWNAVDSELAAGHPVILGVALGIDMGNSYGVSHFVVVTSKMSNGKYAMQDPLGPGRGYNKSQIKAYRVIRK